MSEDRHPANQIPTMEEVAAAKSHMKARMRGLVEVSSRFKEEFADVCPLDEFRILPQRDVNFRAYVFLEKDSDVAECRASGMDRTMQDFVYARLEEVGRGKRDEIAVDFEFDSYEAVVRDFEGNYFLRMR